MLRARGSNGLPLLYSPRIVPAGIFPYVMGTQVTSIACNNCGAALQVSDATRFATCTYCNSQLAVHRTDSAAYTEVLHAVKANTDRIADDVGAIRVQNELEALDR